MTCQRLELQLYQRHKKILFSKVLDLAIDDYCLSPSFKYSWYISHVLTHVWAVWAAPGSNEGNKI